MGYTTKIYDVVLERRNTGSYLHLRVHIHVEDDCSEDPDVLKVVADDYPEWRIIESKKVKNV